MGVKTTGRWAFRVEPEADRLVRQAAEISRRSLTDFVKAAAVVEAERVLADRTKFVLDRDQWVAFARALDRPPRSIPAVKNLLTEPSVFE
jgi:uncharacterized protein (DUF1778 family)